MGFANISKFMSLSSKHIANIDRTLKNIKSDIFANFVHANHRDLIITTNNVTSQLDLSTIMKYIKNIDTIESNNITTSHLS